MDNDLNIIAAKLGLSIHSVYEHLKRVFKRPEVNPSNRLI
jgi:DNA-binding CsgD family transcriptional regulator